MLCKIDSSLVGGAENAGLENAALDFGRPNSKGGKCSTGIWQTK